VNMNENGDDWVSFSPLDVQVSPNGKLVAVFTDSKSGRVILYEYGTNVILSNLWGLEMNDFTLPRLLFLNDEYLLCTSHEKIKIYEIYNSKCIEALVGHKDIVRGLSLTKDAFVACSFDSSISEWPFSISPKEL
jgi:COMPASS component SWD3